LLPSITAALRDGPKHFIFASSSKSTAPRHNGSSGATTAKSILFSTAKSRIFSISLAFIGTQTASAAMPPFPGSAKISVTSGFFFQAFYYGVFASAAADNEYFHIFLRKIICFY
jgi:hypothetical protein